MEDSAAGQSSASGVVTVVKRSLERFAEIAMARKSVNCCFIQKYVRLMLGTSRGLNEASSDCGVVKILPVDGKWADQPDGVF